MAIKIIRSLILLHCGRACGKGQAFIVWWHFWNQLENLPCLFLIAALTNLKPQQNQSHPPVLWFTQNTEPQLWSTGYYLWFFLFHLWSRGTVWKEWKAETGSTLRPDFGSTTPLKWCSRPIPNRFVSLTSTWIPPHAPCGTKS